MFQIFVWYVFAKSGHAGNRGCIDGSVSLSSSFLEERNARLEKCRYSEIRYEVRQALVKWWKGGGREAVSERERGWGGSKNAVFTELVHKHCCFCDADEV